MVKPDKKGELPPDYEQLRQAANRTSSWKDRLAAVDELGRWKSTPVVDLLTHRMTHDPVYQVQEAAYRKLKEWGEDVQPPRRKKGELIKGASKVFVRIQKSLPEGHSFEEFKDKLQRTRLDVYDAYEGDKGADFDKWLQGVWETGRQR